ncbi:MAG: UDP-N-acetylmuramate dehydrogenase [Thermotogota bacterium]|nr:UDP-N-acetylmuramate dehydrogenase [Thermotogota bacterium]
MVPIQLIEILSGNSKGTILKNEQMKNHTSFHIGGLADIIIPKDVGSLKDILRLISQNNIPVTIVGNGTNLLVSDDGVEGVVIKIKDCLDHLQINNQKITIGAGFSLSKLSEVVANHGLSGLEFAIGIPGSVGGAVVMNAGAHGGEMSDVITKVMVMNFQGVINEFNKSDLEFGYRKSKIQNEELIVFEVEMELKESDFQEINEKMVKFLEWRKKNQPIHIPNAGSIFKNPENDYAGRLIDLAGCKGMNIGGAQVSELKANFIVNNGNATAQNVLDLMNKIQDSVLKKFGVSLVPEIKMMGFGSNVK